MKRGFTLIELLVVIAIIAILAMLVLRTAGYVQQKAARSRANAEIAALQTALESYKVDNGDYPRSANYTDSLSPDADYDSSVSGALTRYGQANAYMLNELRGGVSGSNKVYFEPPKSSLATPVSIKDSKGDTVAAPYLLDPFGQPYGYSTKGEKNGSNFFDMWSTAGQSKKAGESVDNLQGRWEKNW